MKTYDELLGPSAKWKPLLDRGVVTINRNANRLVWNEGTRRGEFAARLVPSPELSKRLADLPTLVEKAAEIVKATKELSEIAPALEALQLISTIGSIASVVGVAVSIAGFATVMHKLDRIEGKLDQLIVTVDGLKRAVDKLGVSTESFLLARLQAAHQHLDRSLAASTVEQRRALAEKSRDLFLESRQRYLALWTHADPWRDPSIAVITARELQCRYVVCAVGELQAQMVLGDRGAYVHTARSVVADVKAHMGFDVQSVFRLRSDALVAQSGNQPIKQALTLIGDLPRLAAELTIAGAATSESRRRLEAAEADADLPDLLGLPAHEILRVMQDAPGVDIYALGSLDEAG